MTQGDAARKHVAAFPEIHVTSSEKGMGIDDLRAAEPAIRERISARLGRGKVECRLNLQSGHAVPRGLALDDVDPASVPYFSLILVHRRGMAWR